MTGCLRRFRCNITCDTLGRNVLDMQLKDQPLPCIRQCCLFPTRLYTPSLVRLCSARHGAPAAQSAKNLVRETRRPRRSASCCHSATPSADQTVERQAQSVCEAFRLVKTLATDLASLKQTPLPSSCSLSIYRLTGVCSTAHETVAFALAQVCICRACLQARACMLGNTGSLTIMSNFFWSPGMTTLPLCICNCRTADVIMAMVCSSIWCICCSRMNMHPLRRLQQTSFKQC